MQIENGAPQWRGPLAVVSGIISALALTAALAAPGDLDPTFGTGGKVMTNFGASAQSYNMTLQSDGKVIVVGAATGLGSTDYAVARYNPDGSLDSTFGGDGKVTTDLGTFQDNGHTVAVQSDGKIVVGGATMVGIGNWDFGVVRYLTDGNLDPTFGSGGIVTTDFGSVGDYGLSLKVQPDGKIVFGGYVGVGGSAQFALARYNSDGSLDSSFGAAGKVVHPVTAGNSFGYNVVLQSDGKILLGGFASSGYNDFALARYNTDGSLDTGFGSGGKVTTDVGGVNDYAYALAVQADGKILLGGYSFDANSDFSLVRYHSNGSLDSSFGSGGKVITDLGSNTDYGISLGLQSDGKIFLSGMSSNGSNTDFALVRYNTNGSRDSGFGSGGIVLTDVSGGDDTGTRMAVQTDGKAVLAGWSRTDRDYFSVTRYGGSSADVTPPACVTGAPISAGGQVYVPFTISDSGSGIAKVLLLPNSSNVHLESPLGTAVPGNDLVLAPTESARVIYAVKNNPAAKAVVALRITDGAGNVTLVDPVVASLEIKKARQLMRVFGHLPANEHYVTLQNGAPGLSEATLWINGKISWRGKLSDGQTVSLDVRDSMRRGRGNSVQVAASGRLGASALLTIGDAPVGGARAQNPGASNLEFVQK